jgi:hypothetical protein
MTAATSLTNTSPPAQIYLIRHGEKPADPPTPTAPPSPPFGIDVKATRTSTLCCRVDGNVPAHWPCSSRPRPDRCRPACAHP